MKKKLSILTLIPLVLAILFAQNLWGQQKSQRMVLLEQFTNTG